MAELDDRKEALIAQLDRARSRITANRRELGEDLNVPVKLKASFKRHRGIWLGVATLVGLVIAKIPPRTKKVVMVERRGKRESSLEKVEKAGLLIGVLKFVFDLAKPFLLRFGKALVQQAMERRRARQESGFWSHV